MSIKWRSELIPFATTFATQLPPLGDVDLAYLRRAMAVIAPDCSVELEGICPQDATLVVVPEDGDDLTGPSFVIGRETYGLRVSKVHWDVVTEVGVFVSLKDVVTALQVRLAFRTDTDRATPAVVTLH